jgi:ribonuclease Z
VYPHSRNVSALAIRNSKNKDWILVDAGEGTQHRIQQAKLSLQNLVAICITHVHGDHCYGLVGLLASAGMNARTAPLTIIAPKKFNNGLKLRPN